MFTNDIALLFEEIEQAQFSLQRMRGQREKNRLHINEKTSEIKSVIRHLICGNILNWLLNLNLEKWLVDFNTGKTQLVSFDQSNNNGSIDVKMDWSVLEEKSSFKMFGLTFSSKLDWGSYIISIDKTASKKIGALIRSVKFFSSEVALYLCKCTIVLHGTLLPYLFWCSKLLLGIVR